MLDVGPYIWRSKDKDYPVVVLSFLGKGPDGREYAKIAGSNTAVPIDELQKIEKEKIVKSKKPPCKRLF